MSDASAASASAAAPRSVPRGSSPIATAMAVLRCFSATEPLLGVVELADRVGIHKSSMSRLLSTLESEELVEQDPVSRKYRLGLGLLEAAGPLLARLDVRRAALPVLRDLAAAEQETASLLLWDGHGAVTVEQAPSPRAVKHSVELGTRYSAAENASVRVLLRELPEADRRRAAADLGVDEAAWAALRADDDDLTALNDGQAVAEEIGIAAPVRDHRGTVIAAVLLAAPRFRITDARIPALRAACAEAAAAITRRLGGATAPASPSVHIADTR